MKTVTLKTVTLTGLAFAILAAPPGGAAPTAPTREAMAQRHAVRLETFRLSVDFYCGGDGAHPPRFPRTLVRLWVRPGEPFYVVSAGGKTLLWMSGTLHPKASGKYSLNISCSQANSEPELFSKPWTPDANAHTGQIWHQESNLELDKPMRANMVPGQDLGQTVTLTRALL